MFTLRPATAEDLPRIHALLDSPARELLLPEPLSTREEFLRSTADNLQQGTERYDLLERNGRLEGVIRILPPEESCEIWGAALRTLFYNCGRIAFEDLGMPRLWWQVRANNRRMMRTCELFRIRQIGEAPFCHIGTKLSFVAAGVLHYYEFTPEEYRERIPLMQSCAIPVIVL